MSLSGSKDAISFGTKRVTSSSMPVPTQFPDAQGWSLFFGDYTGLSVENETAHPVWSDTRNPELFLCPGTGVAGVAPAVCTASFGSASLANDQEIYTDSLGIPPK